MKQLKSRLHQWHDRFGTLYLLGMAGVLIGVNVFVSSIIFGLAEPEVNSWFDSIYWTITTLSTVGYGDITPDTVIGQIVAMFNMIIGVALFPAFGGIIVGIMNNMWQKQKDVENAELKEQNAEILNELAELRKLILAHKE